MSKILLIENLDEVKLDLDGKNKVRTKEQRRFAPTLVSEITGLGVQIHVDLLSGFDWNGCPNCVEYTTVV